MTVQDYKILRAGNNPELLEQLVMQALKAGWTLHGGASYGGGNWMQTVVRVASEPKAQSASI